MCQAHWVGIHDPTNGVDETVQTEGETVYYRNLSRTPSGTLNLKDAKTEAVLLTGRAIKPVAPAGVKINGKHWATDIKRKQDITLTWHGRNRRLTTPNIHWYYGHTAPEDGVTYSVRVENPVSNTVLFSVDGLSDHRLTIPVPKRFNPLLTLPVSDGLIYYFNFELRESPSPRAQGSNTRDMVVAQGNYVDGATTDSNGSGALGLGYGKYYRLPHDETMNNNSLTFGFRVNTGTASETPLLYFEDDSANSTRRLGILIEGSTVSCYLGYRNSEAKIKARATVPTNQWFDLIVVFDEANSRVTIWVNGEQVTRQTVDYAGAVPNLQRQEHDAWIGVYNGNNYANGSAAIDHLFMFGRALAMLKLSKLLTSQANLVGLTNYAFNCGRFVMVSHLGRK